MDDIVISIGKMVQTISGASNGLTNLAFRYFSDDYSDFNAACDAFDASPSGTVRTDSAGDSYTVYCGTELAQIFKRFLTYQVPQYQINEYSQPKTQV